jgi:hypothetical protein
MRNGRESFGVRGLRDTVELCRIKTGKLLKQIEIDVHQTPIFIDDSKLDKIA